MKILYCCKKNPKNYSIPTSSTEMLRVPIWKQQAERLNETMNQDHNMQRDSSGDDLAPSSGVPQQPQQQVPRSNSGRASATASTGGSKNKEHVTMLEHVRLYRQLQANWQSYDAYARVAMSMGTNQLLHALTYYVLGYLIIEVFHPLRLGG